MLWFISMYENDGFRPKQPKKKLQWQSHKAIMVLI